MAEDIGEILRRIQSGESGVPFQVSLETSGGQHIYKAVQPEIQKFLEAQNATVLSATQLVNLLTRGYKDFDSEIEDITKQLESAQGDLRTQLQQRLKEIQDIKKFSERKAPVGTEIHKLLELQEKGEIDLTKSIASLRGRIKANYKNVEELKTLFSPNERVTDTNLSRAIKQAQKVSELKTKIGATGGSAETARAMTVMHNGRLYVLAGTTDWTKGSRIVDYKSTSEFHPRENIIQTNVNANLTRAERGQYRLPIKGQIINVPTTYERLPGRNPSAVYTIEAGAWEDVNKMITRAIDIYEGRTKGKDLFVPGEVTGSTLPRASSKTQPLYGGKRLWELYGDFKSGTISPQQLRATIWNTFRKQSPEWDSEKREERISKGNTLFDEQAFGTLAAQLFYGEGKPYDKDFINAILWEDLSKRKPRTLNEQRYFSKIRNAYKEIERKEYDSYSAGALSEFNTKNDYASMAQRLRTEERELTEKEDLDAYFELAQNKGLLTRPFKKEDFSKISHLLSRFWAASDVYEEMFSPLLEQLNKSRLEKEQPMLSLEDVLPENQLSEYELSKELKKRFQQYQKDKGDQFSYIDEFANIARNDMDPLRRNMDFDRLMSWMGRLVEDYEPYYKGVALSDMESIFSKYGSGGQKARVALDSELMRKAIAEGATYATTTSFKVKKEKEEENPLVKIEDIKERLNVLQAAEDFGFEGVKSSEWKYGGTIVKNPEGKAVAWEYGGRVFPGKDRDEFLAALNEEIDTVIEQLTYLMGKKEEKDAQELAEARPMEPDQGSVFKDEKKIKRALKNKKKALKTKYRLEKKIEEQYYADIEPGDKDWEKLEESKNALLLNLLSYEQSLEPHDYLSEVTDFINLTPEDKEKMEGWIESGGWSTLRRREAPPDHETKAKDYAATPEVVYEPPKEVAKEIADTFKEGAESAEKRIEEETAEKIEEVKSTTANIGLPYSKQALPGAKTVTTSMGPVPVQLFGRKDVDLRDYIEKQITVDEEGRLLGASFQKRRPRQYVDYGEYGDLLGWKEVFGEKTREEAEADLESRFTKRRTKESGDLYSQDKKEIQNILDQVFGSKTSKNPLFDEVAGIHSDTTEIKETLDEVAKDLETRASRPGGSGGATGYGSGSYRFDSSFGGVFGSGRDKKPDKDKKGEEEELKRYKANLNQVTTLMKEVEVIQKRLNTTPSLLKGGREAGEEILVEHEGTIARLNEENSLMIIQGRLSKEQVVQLEAEAQARRKINSLKVQGMKGGAQSIFDVIRGNVKNTITRMFDYTGVYRVLNQITASFQKVITLTKELDTATFNLRVVSGANAEEARGLIDDYNKLAKQLGATTVEIANAANEWLN